MTREEAIKINAKSSVPRLMGKELINKIYDDFEKEDVVMETLKKYLNEPSVDGTIARNKLRKELIELVVNLDD